jgi:hypothetical protein
VLRFFLTGPIRNNATLSACSSSRAARGRIQPQIRLTRQYQLLRRFLTIGWYGGLWRWIIDLAGHVGVVLLGVVLVARREDVVVATARQFLVE